MRRLLRPSLLVMGTTAALVGGGSMLAFAGWTSRTVSPTFTIHATRVPQVPKPTVTLIKVAMDPGALDPQELSPDPGANPTIQWTKVELTPDEDVERYIVTRHAGPVAAVVCILPATKTPVCIDKTAPAGNVLTYTVAATYGSNWVGEDSEPSPAVTMPGTPVVVTASGAPPASAAAPSASAAVATVPPRTVPSSDIVAPSIVPITPTSAPTTTVPVDPTTAPEVVPTTTEPATAETTAAPDPEPSAAE